MRGAVKIKFALDPPMTHHSDRKCERRRIGIVSTHQTISRRGIEIRVNVEVHSFNTFQRASVHLESIEVDLAVHLDAVPQRRYVILPKKMELRAQVFPNVGVGTWCSFFHVSNRHKNQRAP